MSAVDRPAQSYRLRILGHLDPAWSTWFDSLAITQEDDGTTTLTGPLVDQAALYGLLGRLRDLGATLLGVEQLVADGQAEDAVTHEVKSPARRRTS